jgi:hypothetical protein
MPLFPKMEYKVSLKDTPIDISYNFWNNFITLEHPIIISSLVVEGYQRGGR